MLIVSISCPTFVACRWKRPTRFSWRLGRPGEDNRLRARRWRTEHCVNRRSLYLQRKPPSLDKTRHRKLTGTRTARVKALHHLAAKERNLMRHLPRLLVPHVLLTLQVVQLRPRHQPLHNGLRQDVRSPRSPRLPLLPLSCRNPRAELRHLITDAHRPITSPPLSLLVDTHRISAHRSHPRNKLHTTHNIMRMLISDSNHRIHLSQEHSTATPSLTHTLSPRSLHPRNSSLNLRQRILDSSSSSNQHQL